MISAATSMQAAMVPLVLALHAAAVGTGRDLHAAREACVKAVARTPRSPGVHVYAALAVALHEGLRVA